MAAAWTDEKSTRAVKAGTFLGAVGWSRWICWPSFSRGVRPLMPLSLSTLTPHSPPSHRTHSCCSFPQAHSPSHTSGAQAPITPLPVVKLLGIIFFEKYTFHTIIKVSTIRVYMVGFFVVFFIIKTESFVV